MRCDMMNTRNNNMFQTEKNIQQQSQSLNEPQMKTQNGFHPFYIFPLLYVVSVYLMPVWLHFQEDCSVLFYLFFLPLLFGIINIIVSIRFCKSENRIILLNATVLTKYALIPFFLAGGCIVLLCLCLSLIPVPFMIFVGPTAAGFCCVIGWLILAFEAPFSISYLCASAKANVRPKAVVVVHSILQFFFTMDVIDVMVLTFREQRWVKLTIGVILLLMLTGIALIAWIGIGIIQAL